MAARTRGDGGPQRAARAAAVTRALRRVHGSARARVRPSAFENSIHPLLEIRSIHSINDQLMINIYSINDQFIFNLLEWFVNVRLV